MGMLILGIFMILYGVFVIFLSITKKPAAIWNMGKVQGFVKILGETGTKIFFIILIRVLKLSKEILYFIYMIKI